MSGNTKTLNSSSVENNILFDEWHEQHHKHAFHHHHGGHNRFKDVKQTYLLLGSPNVGKSTFFNKITTSTAMVSNVDRLTVEDTVGRYRQDKTIGLVDLPGVYNLSHPVDEEKVVAHELFNEHFDKIINIVGAQSIQRDLMLTLQCIETGLVNTVVVNMIDEVVKDAIDIKKLSKYLNNTKVIFTQANRNKGIDQAEKSSIKSKLVDPHVVNYSERIESYIRKLSAILPIRKVSNRFYSLMLLEGNEYVKEELQKHFPIVYKKVSAILKGICLYDEIIATKREYIHKIVTNSTCVYQPKFLSIEKNKHYKADRILLNKWVGIPAFLLLMVAIYFIAFGPWTGGGLQTLLADNLFDKLIIQNIHGLYGNAGGGAQWIANIFVDGILNGFFAVLSFVPVIVILFFLVNIINQVGILSRVSVLLDKTFEKFGISGRSIVNLLTGFGCSVPAIMMARSTNSRKEKIISILIAPFVACSARVIVIAFVCNIIFGQLGWIAMVVFTICSGLIALFMGLFFSKTMFRKTKSFFLIEMVGWRKPDFIVIFKSVWLQLKEFVKKAALIIVGISLVVWLLLHICPGESFNTWYLDDQISNSLLGYGSRYCLQYIFLPIGFGDIGNGLEKFNSGDGWKLTASLLSALPAKEIAVTNLEMLYSGISDVGFQWSVTTPEALSYLIMVMLIAPCGATCAVIKKEAGLKNLGISLASSFCVAYVVAGVVYWISFAIIR
ncbi:MAG: ferrous iron transport protein B [Mycoplasmataceae bacterium]|nr:ferrous iron transport protein B [Mycoplasmataceae bacterium]